MSTLSIALHALVTVGIIGPGCEMTWYFQVLYLPLMRRMFMTYAVNSTAGRHTKTLSPQCKDGVTVHEI